MGDTDGGFSDNPWQNLDRLAFCENAILLEVKDPHQGKVHKTRPCDSALAGSWRDEQSLRNFLDDVALVAAGPGGKGNIVATCLEWETSKKLRLRVARNEGLDENACNQLKHFLDRAIHYSVQGNRAAGSPTRCTAIDKLAAPQETLLETIVFKCRKRLGKHTSRLLGQLKHAQCRAVGECSPPDYSPYPSVTESKENVKMFGPYDAHTHTQYMEHVARQLNELRNLCSETDADPAKVPPSTWCRVSTVAYQCRGSGALRLYLKENLCLKAKVGVLDTNIDDIIERIGKLARFYRASKTITTFTARLANEDISLTVQGVPTHKIEVEELKDRTVANVLARGGPKLRPYPEAQIWNMIQRWPRYRVHAEIQLVIFYEEHLHLETVGPYIGGDKLCCYLCHEFLIRLDRFQGNGCHQSLYSLWMVPKSVVFVSLTRATQFQRALKGVCSLLENRVATLHGQSLFKRFYGPQNESFANLSRISLRTFVGRVSTPSKRQLIHDAEAVFKSPTPLPSCKNCENSEHSMVSSYAQIPRTLSPPSSLVALDVQALESPIPSQQVKCVQSTLVSVPEDSGDRITDVRRPSSAAAREHEGRCRRRRRQKRSHHIRKGTTASLKRASYHRPHGHHRHRHQFEGLEKKRSLHRRSQVYPLEKFRSDHRYRRQNWEFTQLVADTLRRLLFCRYSP